MVVLIINSTTNRILSKHIFVSIFYEIESTKAIMSNTMPTALIVTPKTLLFDFFSFNALARLIIAMISNITINI